MRAREPDREGYVDRDGVKLHYGVFGDAEPTLVLVPSNPIVHSRQGKAQVPFRAPHRPTASAGRGSVRPGARQLRWLGEDEPPLLAGRLSRLRRVLLLGDAPGAALHQAARGLRGLGLETSAEVMLAAVDAPSALSKEEVEEICRRVRAPLLIVHGDDDRCQPYARAERLAELTGAPLVTMQGAGHMLPARHPVKINLLIKDFVDHHVKAHA